ncbi:MULTISPECIES: type 1 glutamine amidotransferase domain-containing protein [unclassified Leptolyngbya]|uniref:type 1 glutamine amidotransferase domain-containing protein n=1 Tax=unclassified Leptolyngbya TaxID=2650499 RepID=UPI001685448D|nr:MULTISPECIES: type 1 glutamine amidotransferase domain-containing protein [unclassified Leptolyngbya]MBD1909736.1 type 1 glutamine amidotransferase [Leptolyngbya sp. FACHB-8]MBD2156310.1 type 1 glutamine amidotransferase [Leptolyngbya sp. FACHB-16]
MVSEPSGSSPKRIAFLVENHFEDVEFQIPFTALRQAGAEVKILGSRMTDEYVGKHGNVHIRPDASTTEVRAEDFDGFVIPGGYAPDRLRTFDQTVRLVVDAIAQNKIIATVCHGPQLLIEADQLHGKQATGFRAIRKDMQNAGANYVNQAVVVDGNLITSRRPGDMVPFTLTLLNKLNLQIPGKALPNPDEQQYELWHLAEQWGGSTLDEIVSALSRVFLSERYTLTEFQHYERMVEEADVKAIFRDIESMKANHIELLERRLRGLKGAVTWQAVRKDAFTPLQDYRQAADTGVILRRSLGDLQTGAIDANQFASQLTDPITVQLLEQISMNLERYEEQLGDLYRTRMGTQVQPPIPTMPAAC